MKTPLLDTIRAAWGWSGLEPAEVVASNPFGNLIVRAVDGAFWRLCPEEWSCAKIARHAAEFAKLSKDPEFQVDWKMSRLVRLARRTLGPLAKGQCYCLKMPAVIGGRYEAKSLGLITLEELIAFAGDMAEQIKDLPDGGEVEITIVP